MKIDCNKIRYMKSKSIPVKSIELNSQFKKSINIHTRNRLRRIHKWENRKVRS